MKATKKIVGAACALVAAVALSAGSTFAWFASNNTVSANGLQLTVNTSSSYLIIGDSTKTTVADVRGVTGTQTTTNFTASSELTPVAHENIESADKVTSNKDGKIWYTQIADTAGSSTSTKEKTYVDYSTTYVLADTVHITVKEGSGDSDPLHVSSVAVAGSSELTGTQTVSPVSIIFVCGNNIVEFKNQSGSTWTVVGENTKLADKVVDAEGTENALAVNVYVYYDGANSAVYTDNATNLVGATVSVTFNTQKAAE